MFRHYMHNAHSLVVQFAQDGRVMRELPFPELSSASVWGHWSKPPVWCGHSSFTHPFETARFDPSTGIMTTVRKTPVPIDTSSFRCEQVWVESQDGTRVSMFLMYREGIARDGGNPTILSGYGGFDVPMTPAFSTADAVVLENGGVVAVANIRGGGEYGRDWHMAATREGKQRSFDDFIAAAEWLVREGYTSPEHLAISGGSNGGLLVGAVLTQRPDLFRAVLCDVPLLDMVNYTRFGIADIWIPEYGDPSIESDRVFIEKYSPYQNIRAGTRYPAVLFTAAENDARVSPVHAWKMTARLQWEGREGPFLLRMLRDQGHLGAAQMTDGIRDYAQALAFVFEYVDAGEL